MARRPFNTDTPNSTSSYGDVASTEDRWDSNGVQADGSGNVIKGNQSGAQTDVDRFRNIGDDMQVRPEYQFDWTQADQSHANGAASGAAQNYAANAWQDQATGKDRTAYNYGQSLLNRGAQNQQAGALSTSGGPLAQVGASARAQNAKSGFMQKGTNELEAQHADDMAAGRAGWSTALGQTQKMNQTAQSLSDQQAELQAQAAAQQRRLNDAGQYGMEGMGVRVEGDAAQAAAHQQAIINKMKQDQQAASDAKDARAMSLVGSAVGAIPIYGGAMNAGMGAARQAETDSENSDKDPNSDERVKDKLPMGALAKMVAGRSYESGSQHAPKGYAASRRGQEGDMFGGGPSKQGSWSSSWDADHEQAPGTRDVLKYGTPSTRSEKGIDDFSKAVMVSDEAAKQKAQDEEETRKFMEGSKPVAPLSKEDKDKEEYELREQARADKKKQEGAVRQNRIDWVNKEDADTQRKAEKIPLLARVLKRGPETDDEKVARAESWHKREQDFNATRKSVNDWASSMLPDSVRGAAVRAPVSMGYRPEHDKAQPGTVRQPTDFKREESTSDEDAKTKIQPSGYEDTKVRGLGVESKDGGDTTLEWDGGTKGGGHSRDVVLGETSQGSEGSSGKARLGGNTGGKVNLADAERARAEAIRARKAAQQPAQQKTREYTNDELKKMGEEMRGNVQAQSDAQLGAGASVRDSHDSPKWLDDYMTSDRDSKYTGGEEKSANPLIEMQKGANRELRGETYRYKDGYGEDTNRVHHGFMAQNLEKNPITATAVREGDDGVKKVNNEDALRVTAAGVASLQDQHDELEAAVDALAARRKKKVA